MEKNYNIKDPRQLKYRISSYSFRGNYSFLNLKIQRSQYIRPKVTVHKCAETIQGRKLFKGGNYMRKYGMLILILALWEFVIMWIVECNTKFQGQPPTRFCSLYFKWVELNIFTTSSKLTLTWYSVRLVHITISSLMLISGYRFLVKSASNSCNCWLVKWVRLRRWLLLFLLFFPSLDPSNWLSEWSQLWLGNSKWYKLKKLSIFFHLFISQISANSFPVKLLTK